ncbi:hypothetical protein LPAF129_14250 [Ligilactobacillus pabuli]|uniref:DNA-directed RNA polymerase beta subunit n=1 Tax=Ligilactobacillus pabuli TaxID=2886039 RepID=A0ABQ5JI84_9LACO|nr:hypothetical protein [Ligilactobacillus pabuli]GKS81739.1 hypothetical protein LPAF129_14250 [Ligilactobacillus pabuli]
MVYKKRLKYNPADFNEAELQHFFDYEYQDRGMLKWQGFFLSDHTSALKQVGRQTPPVRQPQQADDEISRLLMQAWQTKKPVTLQLEEVDDNLVPVEVSGIVAGYRENEVVLQHLTDQQTAMVLLESIRNVRAKETQSANEAPQPWQDWD